MVNSDKNKHYDQCPIQNKFDDSCIILNDPYLISIIMLFIWPFLEDKAEFLKLLINQLGHGMIFWKIPKKIDQVYPNRVSRMIFLFNWKDIELISANKINIPFPFVIITKTSFWLYLYLTGCLLGQNRETTFQVQALASILYD
jgi:hypothetical protein